MPQLTTEQLFRAAVQNHRAGHLAHAERLYRQVLAHQPSHPDATLNLALLAHQAGQNTLAIELARKAIALRPNSAVAHCNLGIFLLTAGNPDQAITSLRHALLLDPALPRANFHLGNALRVAAQLPAAIIAYRQSLTQDPRDSEALYFLGVSLKQSGQLDEALTAYRQAIAINGQFAEAFMATGNALIAKGQPHDAIAAYRQAIAHQPNYREALANLGAALAAQELFAEAIIALRQSIAVNPRYPDVYCNLSIALRKNGQIHDAIAATRHAIAIDPNYAPAYLNLGVNLSHDGQTAAAIAALRQSLALDRASAEAHYNLAKLLADTGAVKEAEVSYRQAIHLQPNYPDAHYNLALLLLQSEHFSEGWEEYEWRLQRPQNNSTRHDITLPRWNGEPLAGRTLLIHAEQGIGDTLQFVRYVPIAATLGGRIILECQPKPTSLLQASLNCCSVITSGHELPHVDLHCPLMSLPHALRATLNHIPHDVPYLHADQNASRLWRDRLSALPPRVNVGLCWAGNPAHPRDAVRSMPLSALAPLGQLRNIRLFSLQHGAGSEQARPPGLTLIDPTSELPDFAASAALLRNLDLVITVDTATAHLAGALGRPVWLLLPFSSEWRWLRDRDNSPWYPTMRLFRQPSPGDWSTLVNNVANELAHFNV